MDLRGLENNPPLRRTWRLATSFTQLMVVRASLRGWGRGAQILRCLWRSREKDLPLINGLSHLTLLLERRD